MSPGRLTYTFTKTIYVGKPMTWIFDSEGRLVDLEKFCWIDIEESNTNTTGDVYSVIGELPVAGECSVELATFATAKEAQSYLNKIAKLIGVNELPTGEPTKKPI